MRLSVHTVFAPPLFISLLSFSNEFVPLSPLGHTFPRTPRHVSFPLVLYSRKPLEHHSSIWRISKKGNPDSASRKDPCGRRHHHRQTSSRRCTWPRWKFPMHLNFTTWLYTKLNKTFSLPKARLWHLFISRLLYTVDIARYSISNVAAYMPWFTVLRHPQAIINNNKESIFLLKSIN